MNELSGLKTYYKKCHTILTCRLNINIMNTWIKELKTHYVEKKHNLILNNRIYNNWVVASE